MNAVPAVSIEAVLAGLAANGHDTAALRAQLGLAPRYEDPAQLLPAALWEAIWSAAAARDARPELPSLVGLRVPFGLFGVLDYLAGSSHTVRGGLQALADHFSAAAAHVALELDGQNDDTATLRILESPPARPTDIEFTLAVILGRFAAVGPGFKPSRVYLGRPALAGAPHAALFGAPVVYAAPRSGFDVPAACLDTEQSSADAGLHAVLREVSRKLEFHPDVTGSFELSVRARLRDLLPRGLAGAERVARSLGLSERTLHRRLTDCGTSFRELLDGFRIEESERLLLDGRRPLADIALSLGFSDQTTWNRFFRRLHDCSPTEWLSRHSGRGT